MKRAISLLMALTLEVGCAQSVVPDLGDAAATDVISEDRTGSDVVSGTDVRVDGCVIRSEVCNGIDDNCNGATDEGLGQTNCGTGLCQRTVFNCVNGAVQMCAPGAPGTEVCNQIDDDCNGMTDERGVCETCSPEVCNGIDDNCNGLTDDGFGLSTCGVGACLRITQDCVNGIAQVCVPGPRSVEVCDGVDNDCNGFTDENGACGDAGMCPPSTDPVSAGLYENAVELFAIDFGGSSELQASASLRVMPPPPPATTFGSCVFAPLDTTTSPDFDYGTITLTALPNTFTLARDSSNTYQTAAPISGTFTAGQAVTVQLAGGANGPATGTMLIAPPTNLEATVTWPSVYSTTTTTTVNFLPQNDPNMFAALEFYDTSSPMPNGYVLCYVPACSGRFDVPAQATALIGSGRTVTSGFYFIRVAEIPGLAPPTKLMVGSATFGRMAVTQ